MVGRKVLAAKPDLKLFAKDEDELRAACKVGDIDWSYLRFVRDETENGEQVPWRPAAGDFPGWPTQAKDLTILDPCAGSGHFLVFALPILVAIRCAEEHINPEAAVAAVLRDNLFGLEIDPRCTQIAAFNLALAAWRRVGYRALPRLNLACSGLAIGVTKTEWLKLAERAAEAADPAAKRDIFGLEQNLITSGISERVRTGLERLYDLFAKAPWLGSLIDPRISAGDVFAADFSDIEPLLAPLLSATAGDDSAEIVVAAQGMAKAAQLLSKQYSVIATNVPYLGRGKADSNIVEYCDKNFPDAKQDLATVFIRKLSNNLTQGGSLIVVFPQNCFYQSAYLKFRKKILKETTIDCVVTLGEEAWQAFGDRGPLATLGVITKGHHKVDASHVGIDATKIPEIKKKAEWLRSGRILKLFQKQYLQNDDFRILLIEEDSNAPKKTKIGVYAKASQGLKSGDDDRFVRWFWELDSHADWKFMQSTSRANSVVAGLSKIINWDDGGSAIARRQGLKAWGRLGIAVSQMRYLPTALYFGDAFDSNVCAITTEDRSVVGALLAFAHSGELAKAVREIEPGKKVNNGTFEVVPFDLKRWKDEAERKYGNELPTPITNDPKEWLFSGTPRFSSAPLHVAVARLVGYKWPRQCGEDFFLCPSLDADTLEKHADPDGIVCLSAVAGKQPADEKLNGLLAADFGSDWSATRLSSLLAEAGCSGKSLDDWLRDSFFVQHCELFGQRPFVWHVWDGRRDGFNALVNYHRLAASGGEGRRTLEKLIYTYLGDWIDRQRADQKVDVEGADGRLAAAEHLRAELTKILEGDPPYDIMVRWKSLNAQPIGWEPDINDGVRLNIRPLMTARPLGARSATACVLRTTPKIKWDKDGGTETIRDKDDFPWFWGWDGACEDFTGGSEFDGNRWNDLHYSRAVKQAARDRHPSFVGAKV